jgi:cellulose synthase/poly-beta-1,6-N-acetylglucosamine synthase-like glycosyltransferase
MPDFASPWIAAWFWITLAIGRVWLRRHLQGNRGGKEHVLSEQDAQTVDQSGGGADSNGWPSLSVVVAAKDEEQNIARCIDGLLAQDYPRLQVIIANDRSRDRTPQIIDDYARRDPRLTAVHVRELPAGWFGKNNAMREAMQQATGELLCFSDADCAYDSPLLLRAAVSFARREGIEFLSVLPRLEANSLWEKVIQPVAGAIMVFWFPPQKVNDPRCREAYANGAFMLMTRRAYEAIGGHEYAKATLNEDMHMARQAKRVGVRLQVLQSAGLYRVRMYTGLKQIWRGWTRIFYGCFGTLPRLLASVIMLSIFSVSPYVALLASPLIGGSGVWLAAAAAFAIVSQQSILMRFYALTGNAPAGR